MVPKRKYQPYTSQTSSQENPKASYALDLDHIPLADQFFKITYTECEFDMFELHHWLKKTYHDNEDEINLWEYLFPMYMFPQTHPFPDLVMWCQVK